MNSEQRERAVQIAERQRAEQGLPPRIEDVGVLTRIATVMRLVDAPLVRATQRRRKRRP